MAPSHSTDDLEILNLVDEGICACDLQGRITFWNPACEALYGHKRAEALGRDIRQVVHCDSDGPLETMLAEIEKEGRWRGEFRRRNARGEDIVIDARWAIRRDKEGTPIGFIETGRDVTERSRAIEELARSETKFRVLFEHMPLPLVQTNARALLSRFRALRAEGVEDLGPYFDDHPGYIDELLEIITIDEVNQPMVELLGGVDKADIRGCIARFWKTHSDTVRRSLEARFRGDAFYFEESQVDRLDGRLVDVDYWVAYPPEMSDLGMGLTALIDTTERKRATEELSRSEIKFRNLFNQTPIALWQLDTREARGMLDALYASGVTDYDAFVADNPDFIPSLFEKMRITEINQAALALLGATERDGQSPGILPRLFDSMDVLRASAARRRGEASFSTEAQIRTMDDRMLDVLSSVAFADPADPEALNLVAAIDISDRKRADEGLRRSELKFRNLFSKTPIALWQLDTSVTRGMIDAVLAGGATDLETYVAAHPDFLSELLVNLKITEINDAALRLFGAPDVESLRPNMLSLWINSKDLLGASAARAAGERTYNVETRIRTMDGRTLDIWLSTAFGDPADPKDPNLVGAIDISDRKRAEEMLRQVQAEFAHAARVATLGELTASIAHEVNQPLAAIATNGEASLRWLAREEPDIEEVRTLAARMVADARRAADVIARIRAMATGKAPEQIPMSINAAAEAAVDLLRHEFELHQTRVRLELMPDLPAVRADRTQIQQVVVNLAVNAMQAMAQHHIAKPTVTLRTSRTPDGGVVVEVEDNGPGIPPDHLARLFDSFFTTKASGLGIGLSICRSIVEAHGGRIEAANLSGGGARFRVTLPAAPEAVEA